MTAADVRVSLVHPAPGDPDPITVDPHGDDWNLDGSVGRAILRDAPTGAGHPVLFLSIQSSGPAAPSGVERVEVVIDGWRFEVEREPASRAELRDRARRGRAEAGHSGPTNVHAIIPGVVVSVSVAPGDAVAAGQQLLVVEAMKMQNELRAPRDGTVEQVAVGAGARIDVGDLLVVLA
jgi:biotin carboxyl carrier protein